jgi:hypothetical protein
MPRLLIAFLLVTATLGTAFVLAGPNEGVKIALDIQTRQQKRSCAPTYTGCGDITTTLDTTGYYDVMVVVYEYDNIGAVEYEINWPEGEGWYFTSFTSCADFLIGGTSGPPLSVAQAWSDPLIADTDTSGLALGWVRLWSDSSGVVSLDDYYLSGKIRVADSSGVEDTVQVYNYVGVGDSTGSDPCGE